MLCTGLPSCKQSELARGEVVPYTLAKNSQARDVLSGWFIRIRCQTGGHEEKADGGHHGHNGDGFGERLSMAQGFGFLCQHPKSAVADLDLPHVLA
jgi:hypothetical protein